MASSSDITFSKSVYFLRQIVQDRSGDFPLIVSTRDKLVGFDQERIVPERKILYIEEEVEIEVVKIKVLEFHDEDKEYDTRGAEFYELYEEFKGKEFYMPLKCPGKIKFVPYPGRRERYVTVSQIIADNPHNIKSNTDVSTVPPRGIPDHCLQVIPAGTIVEPKAVVTARNSRYMKCVDRNGGQYYIREDCKIDFTNVPDENGHFMVDLKNNGKLLPAVIQFIPGSISPNNVVLYNDIMASNNLVITTAPLKVTEIKRRKMLLVKTRLPEERCYQTLLLPKNLWAKFHVQVAEFESPEAKLQYMNKKFRGCRGHNGFIHNHMYVMPASDNLVCWLQSPKQRSRAVEFVDSSDSDDDYLEPIHGEAPHIQDSCDSDDDYLEPVHGEVLQDENEAPPIPGRMPKRTEAISRDEILYNLVIPPQRATINDKDVLQRLSEKAKLGFNKVHKELARVAEKYRRRRVKNKTYGNTGQSDPQVKSLGVTPKRPLPPLPSLSHGASPKTPATATVDEDEDDDRGNYEDIDDKDVPEVEEKLTKSNEPKGKKITAMVKPDAHLKLTSDTKVGKPRPVTLSPLQLTIGPEEKNQKNEIRLPVRRSNSDAYPIQSDAPILPAPHTAPIVNVLSPNVVLGAEGAMPSSKVRGDNELSTRRCMNQVPPLPSVDEGRPSQSPISTTDFFTYSVAQTVECFRYCGMNNLARLCEDQMLDGDFFKTTDDTEVKETLELSALEMIKLKKIYKGWRPKYD